MPDGETTEQPPSASSRQAFSLPAKPEGEAGELDMENITPDNLPSWLTGEEEGREHQDAGNFVPEWLSELDDEDPTAAERQPEKNNELGEFASWLEGDESESALEDILPSDLNQTEDMPDWLHDDTPRGTDILSQSNQQQEEREATLPPHQAGQNQDEDYPDWLSEIAPAGSAALSSQENDDSIIDSLTETKTNVPDWLSDVLPPTGKMVDTGALADDRDRVSDSLPAASESSAPAIVPNSETGVHGNGTDLINEPDWLADLLPPPTELYKGGGSDAPSGSAPDLPNWLEDLMDASPPVEADPLPPAADELPPELEESLAGVSDWMDDDPPESIDANASSEADGLAETPPASSQLPENQTAPDQAESFSPGNDESAWDAIEEMPELPDWLDDMPEAPEETDDEPATALPQEDEAALPSADEPLNAGNDESAWDDIEPDAVIPDWLKSAEDVAASDESENGSDQANDLTADWVEHEGLVTGTIAELEAPADTPDINVLDAASSAANEAPPAEITPNTAEASDMFDEVVPDWLAETPPEVTDAAVEEDSPPWLDALVETGQLDEASDSEAVDQQDVSNQPEVKENVEPEYLPATDDKAEWLDDFDDLAQQGTSILAITKEQLTSPDDSLATEMLDDLPIDGAMPDWLADISAEDDSSQIIVAEEEQPISEIDHNEEIDPIEPAPDGGSPITAEPASEYGGADHDDEPEVAADQMGDWLVEMSASGLLDPSQLQPEPVDVDEWLEEIGVSTGELEADSPLAEVESDESAPIVATEPEPDTVLDPLGDVEVEETPDWLEEMMAGADLTAALDESIVDAPPPSDAPVPLELASAELPDWLENNVNIAEDDQDGDSAVVGTGSLTQIDDIAAMEIADDHLPDWLGDVGTGVLEEVSQREALPLETDASSQEWAQFLDAASIDEADDNDLIANDEFAALAAPDEVQPVNESEMPAWVRQLKPEDQPANGIDTDAPVQEGGPLDGMRNVIDIEPVIASPRQSTVKNPHAQVSESQQQQAAALKQIALEPLASPAATSKQRRSFSIKRLLGLGAILAIGLAGYFLPQIVVSLTDAGIIKAMPEVDSAYNVVAANGAAPTLLAFGYEGEQSSELDAQANAILTHLTAQNSQLLTLSQSKAAADQAQQLLTDNGIPARNLGFLAEDKGNLRRLADCLTRNDQCDSSSNDSINSLSEGEAVGLIVLFAGEQENLIDWIEQVGAAEIPIVAGVPQSLNSVAQPYYANAQLAGIIQGADGASAYLDKMGDNNLPAQMEWLQIGLLGLAGILLLVFLISLIRSGRQKTT